MSEIRRRKRAEARALKDKKRCGRKRNARIWQKKNQLAEELEQSDDDDIKLERFPIFSPKVNNR